VLDRVTNTAIETDYVEAHIALPRAAPAKTGASNRHPVLEIAAEIWSLAKRFSASSLTRRIVALNLAGLFVLVGSLMYLSQFRTGLIDARIHSLRIHGEIIADAVAASSDPQPYLLLRRLVAPTQTRARLYNAAGALMLDTLPLSAEARTAAEAYAKGPGPLDILVPFRRLFASGKLPRYDEHGPLQGRLYQEVSLALAGQEATFVRMDENLNVVVSVAIPIQRKGDPRPTALLLSTQGTDIDAMVENERVAVTKVFAITLIVMLTLSVLLARSIGEPVRRLAAAAKRVRKRANNRIEIPDFTGRHDEIGELSDALRDMTTSLYDRIEAIESFAADVSHELKNPLTSLRSAVETLPLARNDESRSRLLEVIQHDVRRLDRLISDISDASRLDAEMQRLDGGRVDVATLLETIVGISNSVRNPNRVNVELSISRRGGLVIPGHDSRIGQVLNNLLDNGKSFSPDGGSVRVSAVRHRGRVVITVDDDGPGIPEDAFEKIFQRFYTDRPNHGFGNNSGLGLSISKQIVEAHGGTIVAENRKGRDEANAGARFTVSLPAA
jgi:two-component system, OmpR family, sensor histidine kinase ChvG